MKTDYNIKTRDPKSEKHDIVGENNKVIGVAERIVFLKNGNLIRRSCHIWLKNSKGQYWLQQRSKSKDLQPLHWSCSAAGFVKAGNRTRKLILEDAQRELWEELGIKIDLRLVRIYLHRSKAVGGIMVYLYVGKYDGKFKINKREVSNIKALTLNYVKKLFKSGKIKLTDPTITELNYLEYD